MRVKPLISVIIIFFNAEKFFEEAIASVFAQTYDHWELLLADDGSSDGSTAIAQAYARQYPEKVRYLEHPDHHNRGMSATRNLGIRHAQGTYIAFLDADDVWLPHKLEEQVAIMESQPEAAMLYGQSRYWYSWTGKPEDLQRDFIPELGVASNTLFKPPLLLTLCYPLGKAGTPCPSNFLLRREIVERVGGFEEGFRGRYQLFEDQAFLAKVYLNAPVFVANQCWDQYRLHPDSISSVVNQAGEYHTVRLFFLNWLETYLCEQDARDSQVWNALQKALWPYRHPFLHQLTGRALHYLAAMKQALQSIAQRTLSNRRSLPR